MDNAAANGHLEIIKYLHENRYEGCTTAAIDNAASNNHLEVVKWLYENRKEGCTNKGSERAAKKGYIDIVIFLYEKKMNVDVGLVKYFANKYKQPHIVEWMERNNIH